MGLDENAQMKTAGIATIVSKYMPPSITTSRFQRSGKLQAAVAST